MKDEKKYEILPGVETPDIETINEAASDFTISDVGAVNIKSSVSQPSPEVIAALATADLAELQQLGNKVAAAEERAKAVSRAKMENNKSRVMAPESIGELKASHLSQLDDEKRKAMEEADKEAAKEQAVVDAKAKEREDRKLLQQRIFEEAKQRAELEKAKAQEEEAKLKAEAEAKAKAEEEERLKAEAEAKAKAEEEARLKAEAEKEAQIRAEVEAKVRAEIEARIRAEAEAEAKAKAEVEARRKADAEAKAEEEARIRAEAMAKAAEEAKAKEESAKAVESEPPKRTTKTLNPDESFDDFKEFL